MKNVLRGMEKDDTSFFVMKSYITAAFEIERKKSEYHIFYIKYNSNPDAYYQGYMNLKMRKMNKKEVSYFKKNTGKYIEVMDNDDGTVYNLKGRMFDPLDCRKYKQYLLNL